LSKGYFSLEEEGIPYDLTLSGYGNFNPGDIGLGWIDEDDCFIANGTDGRIRAPLGKSWGVWVYGSKDPSYGTLEVLIDGHVVGTVSCFAQKHETRQLLFSTIDMNYTYHELEFHQVGSKPVAIHAAYHLNTDRGMYEFQAREYHVKAGHELQINLSRVLARRDGSVLVQAWPDTALPGEDYEDVCERVSFKGGEHWKVVTIKTKHQVTVPERRFSLRLSHPAGGIIGFNYSTSIVIASDTTPSATCSASQSLGPSATPAKSKMSKAAIAGIAGGSAVIVIVAVVVVLVTLRKRRAADGLLLTISEDPMIRK
jgi:hypothetical protein